MERWRREHPATHDGLPFALASEGPHGVILNAVNPVAHDSGIKPNQRLTDARAICPELVIEFSDHAGDTQHLDKLGHWARRWSPWTAVEGTDGLLLDSTGVEHCFGGEEAMLKEMQLCFGTLGFTCRAAIAPTVGAAWALSHYGNRECALVERSELEKVLALLPIESLRIDASAALLLRRLGLKTIGALAAVPTTALARRFRKYRGKIASPLHRLQQAFGKVEEVVEPLVPQPRYYAAQRVAEPVQHVAILKPILAELAEQLCRLLESGQRGLRSVCFEAFRVDGHIAQVQVETAAPVRSPEHIVRLLTEKLEALDAGFGFDAFVLTVVSHEAMVAQQRGLEDDEVAGIALPHLLDRLRARLGADNITMSASYASHVPERSLVWRNDAVHLSLGANSGRERPIRLFDYPEPVTVIYATPDGPPRRFRWRRKLHDVMKSEGPERIAPEWWREKSSVRLRDYYKIEDQEGCRFWIYRSGVVGDGRGGPPQWFMHGLFV